MLQPLLERMFAGGVEDGYMCYSSGGDFVLGHVHTNEPLHSDIILKHVTT